MKISDWLTSARADVERAEEQALRAVALACASLIVAAADLRATGWNAASTLQMAEKFYEYLKGANK